MEPPSSYPFTAMTAPPSHTMQNTISNNKVLSSAFVAMLNTLTDSTGRVRQKPMGRHLRSKHEAKEKGTPKVPVADLLALFFGVDLV